MNMAILDDAGNVVPVDDLLVWAEWFERNPDKRRVALTVFERLVCEYRPCSSGSITVGVTVQVSGLKQ